VLTLTPNAESAIREILAAAPLSHDGGLRISADPGSDGQIGFRLALVEAPEPQDRVVEDVDVRVYLGPDAAPLLENGVLDATAEDESVTFTVGPKEL
jgi:Fe-S cluster assembly iron-binding protein IscA